MLLPTAHCSLTAENYRNHYLKKYLYVYLLWLFSLICWDLFTSTYQYLHFPEKKKVSPPPPPPPFPWTQKFNALSPNRINRATITTFVGAEIFFNFRYFVISPFRVLNTPYFFVGVSSWIISDRFGKETQSWLLCFNFLPNPNDQAFFYKLLN